jgi:hypothetical protein
VPNDITAHVMNKVSEAIEEWKNANIDPMEGWPSRDEDLLKLAEEMMDFFQGMKRSSKQELKKKR